MTYEYWKKEDGLWYWHFKGHHDEIIFRSEGYVRKMDCLYAIRLMKESFIAAEVDLTLATQ